MKSLDHRISDGLWKERANSGNVKKWDEEHEFALLLVDNLNNSVSDITKDKKK
jgi:hypothetical protein